MPEKARRKPANMDVNNIGLTFKYTVSNMYKLEELQLL